jgi:predicted nucleotidyltransferase
MNLDARVAERVTAALRAAGACFALVFGSTARGQTHAQSDLDVAAWWPSNPPNAWEVDLPAGVDLVVLHRLPLELAGRIALEGVVLFDDDPPARVHWVADTRKIWLDERWRFEAAQREYLEARTHGR